MTTILMSRSGRMQSIRLFPLRQFRPETLLRKLYSAGRGRNPARASMPGPVLVGSHEGAVPGDRLADDERLHLVGALEGVDGLRVGHEPRDVVVERNPVAAADLAGPRHH